MLRETKSCFVLGYFNLESKWQQYACVIWFLFCLGLRINFSHMSESTIWFSKKWLFSHTCFWVFVAEKSNPFLVIFTAKKGHVIWKQNLGFSSEWFRRKGSSPRPNLMSRILLKANTHRLLLRFRLKNGNS